MFFFSLFFRELNAQRSALARAGKSVLHVDRNEYYGSDDASFPIDQFEARFGGDATTPNATASIGEGGDELASVTLSGGVGDVRVVRAGEGELSAAQLRRCIVDLWPRLLFARSNMIDALVRSGVNRYLEFKCLQACFMLVDGVGLTLVPASKADVFRDKTLSLMQKRSLMKLFAAILGTAAAAAAADAPDAAASSTEAAAAPLPTTGSFDDLLASAKLGPLAAAFTKHAIALDPSQAVNDESSRERNLARCRQYAQSIGVYGATPFLAPLYGAGELAQAYCRLAAVFGATFILQCGPLSLLRGDDGTTVRALRCKEGDIRAKQFVFAASLVPPSLVRQPSSGSAHRLHVCACVLSASMLPSDSDVQLPLIVVPPLAGRNEYSAYAVQLDPSMHVTASGLYMLCLWSRASADEGESSKALTDRVLPQLLAGAAAAPRVLWQASWTRTVTTIAPETTCNNVHVLGNAGGEVELDGAVAEVAALFGKLCPGVEFIERVPNPEDVEWSAPADGAEASTPTTSTTSTTTNDESGL